MDVSRWGISQEEHRLEFPCDRFVEAAVSELYRGVTVNAPAETVFRWLCQLRAAPYSYDWIDNLGRRSPQTLTPGLDQLEVGQTVMTIFRIIDFEVARQITIRMDKRSAQATFGDCVISYMIVPVTPNKSRLLAKLAITKWPRGPWGPVVKQLLPPGDLIMMRRQLLNLKRLAEQTAAH